ncbi:hypothetical protein ACG7TL_005403 [Trametes sanguinea]
MSSSSPLSYAGDSQNLHTEISTKSQEDVNIAPGDAGIALPCSLANSAPSPIDVAPTRPNSNSPTQLCPSGELSATPATPVPIPSPHYAWPVACHLPVNGFSSMVPFWCKSDWKQNPKDVQQPGKATQRGGTRAAHGINVSMRYITDIDGNVIDGYRATAMRKSFRDFCVFLWNKGRAPASWKRGADAWVTERYYAWMTARHPELGYCEDNWWAEQIAVENYSQWRKKHVEYLANQRKRARVQKKHKKSRKHKTNSDMESGSEPAASDPHGADSDGDQEDDCHALDMNDNCHQGAQQVFPSLDAPLYTIPRDSTPAMKRKPSESASTSSAAVAIQKKPRLSIQTQLEPGAVTGAPSSTAETHASSGSSGVILPSPVAPSDSQQHVEVTQEFPEVPDPFADLWSEEGARARPEGTEVTQQTLAPLRGEASILNTTTIETAPNAPMTGARRVSTSAKAAGKKAAIWPPPLPDDDTKPKPKDLCARIWAEQNPSGTKKDFDEWYKGISQSARLPLSSIALVFLTSSTGKNTPIVTFVLPPLNTRSVTNFPVLIDTINQAILPLVLLVPGLIFDLFSAPTPVVVSPSPSPAAPLQFVSTTPPISLDFSDDFRDSPQFFLLTMGDIKPDTIPLLTSASQYSDWVAKIKGVMLFTGCWGPILSQSAPAGEKMEDWKKKDDQAKGLIWMRVATNYHYLLETKETTEGEVKKRVPASYSAKEMWDVLKKEFGTPDTAEAIGLLMAYFNLPPMSDSHPLRHQLETYITRIRDASNGGMNFSEHQQAVFLLMKLPPSYNTLSTSLTALHKLGDWTVKWVQGKVLAEESLRSGDASNPPLKERENQAESLLKVEACGRANSGKRREGGGDAESGTHHESTCWKKHPDQRPKKGGKGKGKGKEKEKKGKEKDNSNNHANAAAPAVNVLVAESLNMHASFYSAAHAAGVRHTHWLMDLGASQHITFDINDFAEYSTYDTPIVFKTAASGEGSSVKALGEGLVLGETFIHGVKWSIDLPKVCYIPMVSSRLFSTGSIEKNGYSIFQGDKKMSIFDKLPSGAVSPTSSLSIFLILGSSIRIQKAMSMLHHAGLSHGFWQLAVEAAVHIYNRQPMRRLKWRCPITAWDGTVPDVSYFRVFGCKAFVHVQKSKREGKLDKKAVEMIFVGYEPGTKGYKFWNPATRSIVVSRDVIFDEESFPARSIPGYRRVTPSDNPFPEHEDRSDDVSNSDSGDLPQIPIPLPLDEDCPPSLPPAPPAPEEDEEPQPPPQPPQPPPQPSRPAVPVPRPSHRRNHHQPVGGAEVPALGNERPRRNRRPPARYREDNIFGDRDPVEVEIQSTEDGDELEAQAIRFVLASQYKSGIPNSHREAMNSPDKDKWCVAEKAEYDSLMENKTWVLVLCPKDRQVLANRWVYDIKHDGRYKARLVAKGFTQVWGEDYHETFSPVAHFESIRYLLAHAALEDWDIESMDVKTAFLNGDLEEEIYMEQPEGWVVQGKENYVCLLKKAIYSLKQALRQWNLKIHKSLLDLGFTRTYSDADQEEYIQSVIERFKMADCKPSRTPLPAGAVLESSEQPEPASNSFCQRYQSLIGSLLYAALGTRPDIDFAVNQLSKYNANPSDAHWHYANQVPFMSCGSFTARPVGDDLSQQYPLEERDHCFRLIHHRMDGWHSKFASTAIFFEEIVKKFSASEDPMWETLLRTRLATSKCNMLFRNTLRVHGTRRILAEDNYGDTYHFEGGVEVKDKQPIKAVADHSDDEWAAIYTAAYIIVKRRKIAKGRRGKKGGNVDDAAVTAAKLVLDDYELMLTTNGSYLYITMCAMYGDQGDAGD